VNIEEIEKHIIEIAFERGFVTPQVPVIRTGKKIAVIGSGPAGLAAAAQLNQAGHTVTVFERDEKPGGLLRYGIPDFKLEKKVIDRRIELLEKEGIVFKCNANVGVNVNLNDLLREYNALVLAGGSTVPRDLNIPGRALNGIHFAMHFLKQQNKIVAGSDPLANKSIESNIIDHMISAKNKKVVVIGGGDTGSDCVGTSNRQGAAEVLQFELMPKPPESRTDFMPWPTYPMVLKTTTSHEEGCSREWAVATKEFIGNEKGELTALKTVELEWKSVDGKPSSFIEKPGSEKTIPCDLVLLAMGFVAPQKDGLIDQLDVQTDERGNVKASEKEFKTKISKIFTCGDMRRGQSLVVWAISEGRECAKKVDEFLMGHSQLESKDASLFNLV
jgi:glutamate synthase (NADPH/NADH) small chain